MTIIENYLPLNSPEKIKSLVDELSKIPGAMNATVRSEIFQNVKGKKLQIHFQQEYPASMFPCSGKFIPEAKVEVAPKPENPVSGGDSNDDIIESYIKKLSYLPIVYAIRNRCMAHISRWLSTTSISLCTTSMHSFSAKMC